MGKSCLAKRVKVAWLFQLLPNGLPDYTIEMSGGEQVKKVKANRPKALCFDYLQLNDMFGLDLETEMVQDEMDLANEVS